VASAPYVAVQALAGDSRVLGVSNVIRTGA
jgi:hypothetical protein